MVSQKFPDVVKSSKPENDLQSFSQLIFLYL
jgi:hypothetical protein